ncbi:MAG: hypothetical protein ABR962_09095 [Candidatus Bathyarchaeia archaeon]
MAIENKYIFIGAFAVAPADAIQVSPPFYQPVSPAEFSNFQCNPTDLNSPIVESGNNTDYENFVGSDNITLEDSGLLKLLVTPYIFEQNQTDPIWQQSNLTYNDFNVTLTFPISVISQIEANQVIQQQQFEQSQTINNARNEGLSWWILGFASLDISIVCFVRFREIDKERKAQEQQAKAKQREIDIFDQMYDKPVVS